jgi:DNA-binding SARP family transcriptional activator
VVSLVRFYLAGRVQVEGPGGVVTEHDLPGRQGRLMLARLTLARGPVSHDQLADLFWGADRPGSWQSTLSPLASRLRSSLDSVGLAGRKMLLSRQGAYELVIPERWVDVEVAIRSLDRAEGEVANARFATAWTEAAVASAILRRPFLEGEDHQWAHEWRAVLSDARVRALACLAESWLADGRWAQAESAADEAIRLDPLRELAHRQRMRAMIGAGNGARALRAYRELETVLTDELGASPSPETEALYEEVLGISRPE